LMISLFPYPGIERFQIIQRDYDLVEIVIQTKEHLNENETRTVESELRQCMGQDCRVKWTYTSLIKPGPSGKFRHVFSELQ
jgi:hypothetical protein